MSGKAAIGMAMTMALMLVSVSAMAGTKVCVNYCVPAVQFDARGGSRGDGYFRLQGSYFPVPAAPCHECVYVVREVHPKPQKVWVQGHYRWERPHRVWVPGHWERVPQKHMEDKPAKYWHKPGRGEREESWQRGRVYDRD